MCVGTRENLPCRVNLQQSHSTAGRSSLRLKSYRVLPPTRPTCGSLSREFLSGPNPVEFDGHERVRRHANGQGVSDRLISSRSLGTTALGCWAVLWSASPAAVRTRARPTWNAAPRRSTSRLHPPACRRRAAALTRPAPASGRLVDAGTVRGKIGRPVRGICVRQDLVDIRWSVNLSLTLWR